MADDETPHQEPTTKGPQSAGPSDSPAAKPAPKRRSRSKPKPAPEPKAAVVLRWKGDESVFTNGIPNRDVTTDDLLSEDDLKQAVKHGTHEQVK